MMDWDDLEVAEVTPYGCANCQRVTTEPNGLFPEGWAHAMDGRNFCEGCHR